MSVALQKAPRYKSTFSALCTVLSIIEAM